MALLASTRRVLIKRLVFKWGATLARITAPWTDPIPLQVAKPVSLIGWPGLHVYTAIVNTSADAPLHSRQLVDAAVLTAGEQRDSVGLVTSRALPNASLGWRLIHP